MPNELNTIVLLPSTVKLDRSLFITFTNKLHICVKKSKLKEILFLNLIILFKRHSIHLTFHSPFFRAKDLYKCLFLSSFKWILCNFSLVSPKVTHTNWNQGFGASTSIISTIYNCFRSNKCFRETIPFWDGGSIRASMFCYLC